MLAMLVTILMSVGAKGRKRNKLCRKERVMRFKYVGGTCLLNRLMEHFLMDHVDWTRCYAITVY